MSSRTKSAQIGVINTQTEGIKYMENSEEYGIQVFLFNVNQWIDQFPTYSDYDIAKLECERLSKSLKCPTRIIRKIFRTTIPYQPVRVCKITESIIILMDLRDKSIVLNDLVSGSKVTLPFINCQTIEELCRYGKEHLALLETLKLE